jgi:hypothetical protein
MDDEIEKVHVNVEKLSSHLLKKSTYQIKLMMLNFNNLLILFYASGITLS